MKQEAKHEHSTADNAVIAEVKEDEVESIQNASLSLAPLVNQQQAHHQHALPSRRRKERRRKEAPAES